MDRLKAAGPQGGEEVEISQYLEIRRCFNGVRRQTPAASRIIFDEFAILCTLHDNKGLSATQIAKEQGISCPTMTHRGNHLTELGYMTRSASTDDRRRLRCSLSRKGTSYVHRTAQSIVEGAPEDSSLKAMETSEVVALVAKMGTMPMSADALSLLCFAANDASSMPIMRIVEATALLQPTVSMAVLRLEENGAIERAENAGEGGRRPMRRSSGCVLTDKGRGMAQEIAARVSEL